MEPVWTSGQPQNLEAAAFDALEWLLWLKRTNALLTRQDIRRLDGAISCLGKFLPDDTRVNQPRGD